MILSSSGNLVNFILTKGEQIIRMLYLIKSTTLLSELPNSKKYIRYFLDYYLLKKFKFHYATLKNK